MSLTNVRILGARYLPFRRPANVFRSYIWSPEKEPHLLPRANDIINQKAIHDVLDRTQRRARDPSCVRDILAKARERAKLTEVKIDSCKSEFVQGLDIEEAAVLLNLDNNDHDLMQELFETALNIKRDIYGNRIVLFAPLYAANYCMNSCTYCAFRSPNDSMKRLHLTSSEVKEEVEALQKVGHKRVLALCGEHPRFSVDQFLETLDVIRETRTPPRGEIRRINVEIPALSISDMRRLKAKNCVGTYTLFQETYNSANFNKYHIAGPKANYEHRLQTMDRAMIAGLDDVGIGALFGLSDFRFEVLAMLQHALHLERTYNAGPHTISIPRIRPAIGAPTSVAVPCPVGDTDFMKLVAVIRCAVPYTGMILSTREPPRLRRELLNLGISQMSAGSRTEVGSYHKTEMEGQSAIKSAKPPGNSGAGQFSLCDERTVDEVVKDLLRNGFLPSWCTACYRLGRTGEKFMGICKRGDISNFCLPNALLTLKEYLMDYASPDTRTIGEAVLKRERENIPDSQRRAAFDRKLEKISSGDKDLYF